MSIIVLIVAKCIVNNSISPFSGWYKSVLIVAKCIVNNVLFTPDIEYNNVLIVAKCIVNVEYLILYTEKGWSINSSKVYCKLGIESFKNRYYLGINSSKVYCK